MAGEDPDPALTWAALLAHWTDLARAAVALPKGPENDRWRASVSSAITLHAVTMALGEIDRLDASERSLALDRARILIDRETDAADLAWQGASMPSGLSELVSDAERALERASPGGGDVAALEGGA